MTREQELEARIAKLETLLADVRATISYLLGFLQNGVTRRRLEALRTRIS